MAINKTELLKDAWANITVGLKLADVAKIHKCSTAYVSQTCKSYGLLIDQQNQKVTAPISTLKKIFWER